MGHEVAHIQDKIKSFRRKYYFDLFLRGLILSLLILSIYFVLAALLEHNLWLEPWARFVTFSSFFLVAAYCIYKFLKNPIEWWIARRGLTEEQSARIIGARMPQVNDRLLNFLQLSRVPENNSLAYASVLQKSREFEPLSFESIIDLKQNRRFARYLLIPVGVILALLVFNKSILTSSADRIIHFSRKYSPAAPFEFLVSKSSLVAFYNEDFTLNIQLDGRAVPDEVFINSSSQRYKMERTSPGSFSYTFEKMQQPLDFQLEAAGFFSDSHSILVYNRPELNQFRIDLEYPRYLRRTNESLVNVGNIEVPEGTTVSWKLNTGFTQSASMLFFSDSAEVTPQKAGDQQFTYKKQFVRPDRYEIRLLNDRSKNKERIFYAVDVIKDQHPSIAINNLQDSILYQRVLLGGTIGDDYGVTQLSLKYSIRDDAGKELKSATIPIPILSNQVQQNFFYNWNVDSLSLLPGYKLEYLLQVWDNDGVNGRKSTKTALYAFAIPTKDELVREITSSQAQTQQKIDESVSKAQTLQEQIELASQKLKGKQNLNWQDKKMLEDIIQQKQGLDQIVEKLQQENKLLDQKKDAFTEQDKRIKEKAEQIQKLMNELLDEETKKLFEELQKLLKENSDINDVQKLLNKLNQNADNLEKELERTLELFKDAQFEFKFDQAIDKLGEQIEKQKEILDKTEQLEKDKKGKNSDDKEQALEEHSKELAKEQEELKNDVNENKAAMEELKKLGEELHKEDVVPEEEETEELIKDQQESQEQLENNEPSKAKSPQQKSMQKMQKMQQKMQNAASSMSMEMDMENLESLRQIIHSLVKLSYDQESLMKQFNELTPNDPRFNTIAQNQLKLKDDSQVLEDSLLALGKRDPFMGSIITREIGELNEHLSRIIEANKERKGKPQTASEMQASMTSINNLALLLDDHFEMMMKMMAEAKPSMGKQKKKGQKPSLSQMQQKLNERIQQLKNSGKSGKTLSEELAEMAAEQERIRKALQEMQDKMKDGTKPGNQLPGKMEQTEMELVNKQLTDNLIKRQQEILTRLLETEKSAREQDLDDERKGETAKDYEKEIPKAFEEYLRLKEKEVELLKTVPPKLYPYYKKEVNEYFKRMGK
jgi:hypothetical protein